MNRPVHLRKRQTAGRAFGEDAVLIRASAGADNEHGEWIPGSTTTHDIRVASAPLPGTMRDQLPEGVRLSNVRRFWITDVEVSAANQGQMPSQGDSILHDGTTYKIFHVDPWRHLRVVWGVREDPQP